MSEAQPPSRDEWDAAVTEQLAALEAARDASAAVRAPGKRGDKRLEAKRKAAMERLEAADQRVRDLYQPLIDQAAAILGAEVVR